MLNYQVRIGWEYFHGCPSGQDLFRDYGMLRVKAVLLGIPNWRFEDGQPDLVAERATALAAAKQADPLT